MCRSPEWFGSLNGKSGVVVLGSRPTALLTTKLGTVEGLEDCVDQDTHQVLYRVLNLINGSLQLGVVWVVGWEEC
jgi:hypothetical protein